MRHSREDIMLWFWQVAFYFLRHFYGFGLRCALTKDCFQGVCDLKLYIYIYAFVNDICDTRSNTQASGNGRGLS